MTTTWSFAGGFAPHSRLREDAAGRAREVADFAGMTLAAATSDAAAREALA